MAMYVIHLQPEIAKGWLYISIRNGYNELVKHLLAANIIDINEPFPRDVFPLFHVDAHASMSKHEIARIYSYVTPLSAAAGYYRYNVMDMLLEAGADIDKPSKHGHIPFLDFSQRWREFSMEVRVKSLQCSMDESTWIENNKDRVPSLRSPGTDMSLLHHACYEHNLELVRYLIQKGAKVDANDYNEFTPLHYAVSKYHIREALQIVKLLVEHGADVNAKNSFDQTPLFNQFDEFRKVKQEQEADLYSAASEMINCLINLGADIYATDLFGITIFDTYFGNKDIPFFLAVLPLLDIQQTDDYEGANLLHGLFSRANIHADVMVVLDLVMRTCRFDVNHSDFKGMTAMFMAAALENTSGVELLLEFGADINHRDKMGYTPLSFAITEQMVETLMRNGAVATSSKYNVSVAQLQSAREQEDYNNLQIIEAADVPQNVPSKQLKIETFLKQPSVVFFNDRPEVRQEALSIQNSVCKLLDYISNRMSEQDPAFEVDYIQLSGSVGETTKVYKPDEFDFVFSLKHFRSFLKTPSSAIHEDTFLKLECATQMHNLPEHVGKYFDTNCSLKVWFFLHRFYRCIHKILSEKSLWEKFPHMYYEGIGGCFDILTCKKELTMNNINHFNITWHGRVYPYLRISIDIVAGFPFPDWFPSWCRTHPLLEKKGCFVVAKRSEHAPEDIRDFLSRLSFSESECDLMKQMPSVLRKGYMLAKHMRDPTLCPVIKYNGKNPIPVNKVISSYLLKNCIMEENEELKDEAPEDNLQGIVHYANEIYRRLGVALANRKLNMFFVPSQNLLSTHTAWEIQVAQDYCKLIQELLRDPECLAEKLSPADPQQLIDA